MIDAVLVDSKILGQPLSSGLFAVAQLFAKPLDDLWKEYRESREFTELHEELLGIKCDSGTLGDYLTRVARERPCQISLISQTRSTEVRFLGLLRLTKLMQWLL